MKHFYSLLVSSRLDSSLLFSSLLFSSLLLVFSLLFFALCFTSFLGSQARFGVEMHPQMEPRGSQNVSQTASGGVWGVCLGALGPQGVSLQTVLLPFGPFWVHFWSPQGGPGTLGEGFGTLLGDFWTSRRAFL